MNFSAVSRGQDGSEDEEEFNAADAVDELIQSTMNMECDVTRQKILVVSPILNSQDVLTVTAQWKTKCLFYW